MRYSEVFWLGIICGLLAILGVTYQEAHAADFRYSTRLSPSDYLLNSRETHSDPVFDGHRVIDLSATIGVGSDCGRINFQGTLQSTLTNIFDSKYFGKVGENILAGAPMLAICYMSPTWCAILKHSQISANWMSKMRLDQCALIDKYVDSRVEDFYQERQGCVRRSIDKNSGDLENAMDSCNGNSLWQTELTNWAGPKGGERVGSNRLLESSAKWAGLDQQESRGSLDLLKALVGDTVVSRGGVSVEYGPRKDFLTPRTYLQSIERFTHEKLCQRILNKAQDALPGTSLDQVINEQDLKQVSPNSDRLLVDKQTIRSLMAMSPRQRIIACQKLSDAVSMTVFTTDANRSLDLLTTLSQNPHLPPNRKQEIEQKRKSLKDSVELMVTLRNQRNEPINQVLSQINEQGDALQDRMVQEELSVDSAREANDRSEASFNDCADGVMCEKR